MNSWIIAIIFCLGLMSLDNMVHKQKEEISIVEQPKIVVLEKDDENIEIPKRFLVKHITEDSYLKHMRDTMKGETYEAE